MFKVVAMFINQPNKILGILLAPTFRWVSGGSMSQLGLRRTLAFIAMILCASHNALGETLRNTYRDSTLKFRISYPAQWITLNPVGQNTRLSIRSPDGTPSATCNIVARKMPESISMSQTQINTEINEKRLSRQEAQSIIVGPLKEARLVESKPSKINNVPGQFGVVERSNKTLDMKIFAREMKFITFTPGFTWHLMCGAAGSSQTTAAEAYHYWEPTFRDILGSFVFEV
ncbi:MAG: hypothetical protein ACYC2E_06110 [Sulfuricella sp.]